MLRLISGVVLLLLAGILFGSVGTWILLRPFHPPGPWDHRDRTARAVESLAKELTLSEAQKEEVEKIFEGMSERIHERIRKERPELDKIMDESFAEIRKQLTDTQKKRFDTIRKRLGRFPGKPGGPGPGAPFPPPPMPPG